MELLKQPLGKPLSLALQVITLVAAAGKKFVGVPVNDIKKYQAELLAYFENSYFDIISEIEDKKVLDNALKEKILAAADSFQKGR